MSTATHSKTNERPGIRAVHRGARVSASKVREVLDLIRNKPVGEARTILQFTERGAAALVIKVLDSAVANAANNDDIPPDELYVAACFADEGPTMNRWRPRARGRATRIRKRTAHITVIVGRYTPAELDERRSRSEARGQVTTDAAAQRARRVARSKAAASTESAVDEAAEGIDDAAAEAGLDEAAAEEINDDTDATDADAGTEAEDDLAATDATITEADASEKLDDAATDDVTDDAGKDD
ncbi:MAG: 50S ribosomal protein L22 [Actinobacteria bacterium]|nr:50S ribosomal protein L22 [Actinomycetota bacterium]